VAAAAGTAVRESVCVAAALMLLGRDCCAQHEASAGSAPALGDTHRGLLTHPIQVACTASAGGAASAAVSGGAMGNARLWRASARCRQARRRGSVVSRPAQLPRPAQHRHRPGPPHTANLQSARLGRGLVLSAPHAGAATRRISRKKRARSAGCLSPVHVGQGFVKRGRGSSHSSQLGGHAAVDRWCGGRRDAAITTARGAAARQAERERDGGVGVQTGNPAGSETPPHRTPARPARARARTTIRWASDVAGEGVMQTHVRVRAQPVNALLPVCARARCCRQREAAVSATRDGASRTHTVTAIVKRDSDPPQPPLSPPPPLPTPEHQQQQHHPQSATPSLPAEARAALAPPAKDPSSCSRLWMNQSCSQQHGDCGIDVLSAQCCFKFNR
jgi:hypothetical protein